MYPYVLIQAKSSWKITKKVTKDTMKSQKQITYIAHMLMFSLWKKFVEKSS